MEFIQQVIDTIFEAHKTQIAPKYFQQQQQLWKLQKQILTQCNNKDNKI